MRKTSELPFYAVTVTQYFTKYCMINNVLHDATESQPEYSGRNICMVMDVAA
jgi:hypothetical protein